MIETVYDSYIQPPGLIDSSVHHYVCLLKSSFNLKQAPLAWYQWFSSYVATLRFIASISNTVAPLCWWVLSKLFLKKGTLSFEPYFFSEETMLFSHNKSANNTFHLVFSAKHLWKKQLLIYIPLAGFCFFKEKQLPKAQWKEHCRVSLCFVLLGTLLQPRGRPSSPLLKVLLVADLGQPLQLWMSILTISALYVVRLSIYVCLVADSLNFLYCVTNQSCDHGFL
jgi:hypothetical protein